MHFFRINGGLVTSDWWLGIRIREWLVAGD